MLIGMRMHFFYSVLSAFCLLSAGCASYRDTSMDSSLPAFHPPTLSLKNYKSVQSRPSQNPDVAFAVAISGGGHRAANLATGILLELETIRTPQGNLLEEIDYFSTASGGGFAAGTYLSARADHLESKTLQRFSFHSALSAHKGRLLKNLRRDYQTSILTQWIHWRCLGFRDGGDLIERDFDRYLLGSKHRYQNRSLTLGDLFIPTRSDRPVQLPCWIQNATVYENGARFLFTPDFIEEYNIQRYVHNMRYKTLTDNPLSLPLSVGMKASASFPVLIPASTFTCKPESDRLNHYLHLIDGGLSDNLGVQTAIELLKQDPAPRKVLLVIDAYAENEHPYSAHRKSPDGAGAAYRIMNIGVDTQHISVQQEIFDTIRDSGIDGLLLALDSNEKAPIIQQARQVPTSLLITQPDQLVLLQAGKLLIDSKRQELMQLFTAETPAGALAEHLQ